MFVSKLDWNSVSNFSSPSNMTLHITYIPLLYCLLYYRTSSGRAKDIFLGSKILTTDLQTADADSKDEHFTQDSSHHDTSSQLDSKEKTEWASVSLSTGQYGHRSHLHVDSIFPPWRDILYHPQQHRRHHGPQRHFTKRNDQEIHRLCSTSNFRPGQIRHNHRSYHKVPFFRHNTDNNKECLFRNEAEVRQLLPGAFLSHQELEEMLPFHNLKMLGHERTSGRSYDHPIKLSKMVALPHTHSSFNAETVTSFKCGTCFT